MVKQIHFILYIYALFAYREPYYKPEIYQRITEFYEFLRYQNTYFYTENSYRNTYYLRK